MASTAESLETSTYAGISRFTLELEFVTLLSNPHYLFHLASTPASHFPPSSFPHSTPHPPITSSSARTGSLLQQAEFIAYLQYLLYWTKPPYVKYLTHPEPTILVLRLLQQEKFRRDLCGAMVWEVCVGLMESMMSSSRSGNGEAEVDTVMRDVNGIAGAEHESR